MEFPPDWVILPEDDFNVAAPRDPGELGAELMAQVRSNGRIMDHFRVALEGSTILRAAFHTKAIYTNNSIIGATLRYEIWPRDILIRRNMCSSDWMDLSNMVASNDVLGYKPSEVAGPSDGPAEEELCNEDILRFLNGLSERAHCGAAIRWAVGIGADLKLELILQGLPASAASLTSKPTLRG